ncbi:hypothetical protein C0991_009565 [Blastosporella zonata]|nr:hypothetical protein C0991_009565 [Blastosporella zonata]
MQPQAPLLKYGTTGTFEFKSFKSNDLVQFAVTAATLARDISNMSACPPAAAVASMVLLILEAVQYMTVHVDMKWRVRFMKKSSIDDTVSELHALLSDASQSFQMSTLINIHHAVSSRRKTKKLTDGSDRTLVNESESEENLANRTQILFPIDPNHCLSYRDQPQFKIHQYFDTKDEHDANWSHHFQQYRLSDVRIRPLGRVIEGFGWWEGTAQADTTSGKLVLMKRYDRYQGVQREQWLSDLDLLRRLYHPNLPQLIGCSLKNSPVPFILLDEVALQSPQDAILYRLRSTLAVDESSHLVLHFFHQLQSVVFYLAETFKMSPMVIQNFLNDSYIGVDHDDLMLSLPQSSGGHVGFIRNHGVLETLRAACLNMLPRSFSQKISPGHSEDVSIFRDLLVSNRQLIWTHVAKRLQHNDQYVAPTPDDEECRCDASDLPYCNCPDPTWKGFHPLSHAEEMAVWDFGYVPKGKGIESFIRLGNLIKDELAVYSAEDEIVSAVEYVSDGEYPANLPYSSLPNRVAW